MVVEWSRFPFWENECMVMGTWALELAEKEDKKAVSEFSET